jgi:NAD(P)-dependent dehydrogenase (short-subunit alcohol dehydrogenase family)
MPNTVLITGCSSGLGRATAQLFAARGWNVAATARNPAALTDWARGDHVVALPLDVTNEASIASAVAAAHERFGVIDVLVNNAGYGLFGPLEGMSAEQIESQFRTNVFGTMAMIRHVLPAMRARGRGTLINLSSLAGRMADPFASAYDATKYAIEGFSESLRYELKPHGIRVRLIEPGHFKTDFIARSLQVVRHSAYETPLANWMAWMAHADEDAPPPDAVAKTIFKAATDRSNRLRYPVQANFFLMLHALLPDSMWQGMIGEGMNRQPPARKAKKSPQKA